MGQWKEYTGELPPGAVKIGTIETGDKAPRMASVGSTALLVVGALLSAVGEQFSRAFISDITKESVTIAAKYDAVKSDGLLKHIEKAFGRATDLKLWKSNLAGGIVLLGGLILTDKAVKKFEQKTFKRKHGELPRMDQINQILKSQDEPAVASSTARWQEKVAQSEEAQQSTSR